MSKKSSHATVPIREAGKQAGTERTDVWENPEIKILVALSLLNVMIEWYV
jgi:hypothetical protein